MTLPVRVGESSVYISSSKYESTYHHSHVTIVLYFKVSWLNLKVCWLNLGLEKGVCHLGLLLSKFNAINLSTPQFFQA